MVTPRDVGKLNCLVIPKQQAGKQGRAPQPGLKTARARCGSSGTCTGPPARATCSPRAGAASSRTRATVPATSSTSTASSVESELPCPRRQRRPWPGAREQGVHQAEQGNSRRGPRDVGLRPGACWPYCWQRWKRRRARGDGTVGGAVQLSRMPELQLVFNECKGFSYDLQLVIDKCWQRRSSSATPELSIWKRKPVGARRGALVRAHVSVRCVDTFRAVAAFFEFLSPPSSAPHEHMQHTTEADASGQALAPS